MVLRMKKVASDVKVCNISILPHVALSSLPSMASQATGGCAAGKRDDSGLVIGEWLGCFRLNGAVVPKVDLQDELEIDFRAWGKGLPQESQPRSLTAQRHC